MLTPGKALLGKPVFNRGALFVLLEPRVRPSTLQRSLSQLFNLKMIAFSPTSVVAVTLILVTGLRSSAVRAEAS